jgi:hypothetical protein
MTRCIETSRKMQQGYPEFGDATNPDSHGSANCGHVRQRTGFMRIADVGIRSPSAPDGRCKVRVAAGAVERPLFRSNLSTFMSNCILVATTLECNASGRCRTTILPQAHALAPCGCLPHGAFFIAVYADPRRDVCPEANSNVFFSNTTLQ